MRIAWMIPDVIEGSGGLRTIFGKANALAHRGHESDFYFYKSNPSEAAKMAANVGRFFGGLAGTFYTGGSLTKSYDASIATMWDSARLVRDHDVSTKLYFVQDYEAWFNPMGDGVLFAESSFCYGLTPITLGRWLHRMLEFHYGLASYSCDFGVDQSIYLPVRERPREDAVCFIYQPEKPRRCWQLGVEALGIVKALRPSTTIYLYGSPEETSFWFEHVNLKMLTPLQLAALYQKTSVGLCISSSNPSRIPFEMMACGLPVVDVYRTCNLYDYSDAALVLAHHAPESLAAAILTLLSNRRLAEKVSRGALAFAGARSLAAEDQQFCDACESAFNQSRVVGGSKEIRYEREPVVAEVFRTPEVKTLLKRFRDALSGPYPQPQTSASPSEAPERRGNALAAVNR